MLQPTYITIKEAARLLQVCPATLRNWEKRGKLKTYRHPISNYRLYIKEELIAFLASFLSRDVLSQLEKIFDK